MTTATINASNKSTKSSRTAAQQAELDKLRAAKAHAETVQPEPVAAPVNETSFSADALKAAATEAVMKMFGFDEDAPSWKRRLAAFFAAALLATGAGYVIGQLAGYAMVGIIALGGSMLWCYLIGIVAIMVSAYAGLKIGQYVGNYVLSGKVDEHIGMATASVKSGFKKLTGMFKRDAVKLDCAQPNVAA